jgi:hypothetical protein
MTREFGRAFGSPHHIDWEEGGKEVTFDLPLLEKLLLGQ